MFGTDPATRRLLTQLVLTLAVVALVAGAAGWLIGHFAQHARTTRRCAKWRNFRACAAEPSQRFGVDNVPAKCYVRCAMPTEVAMFHYGQNVIADGRRATYAFTHAGAHYVYTIASGVPTIARYVTDACLGAPRQLQSGAPSRTRGHIVRIVPFTRPSPPCIHLAA